MKFVKQVLVHYHIFKNAGTSVDWSLKSHFDKAWVSFEGRHPHDVLPSSRLQDLIKKYPLIRAVSSHLLRPSPLLDPNILPIVFLRHPVLRAKSVYLFTKADSSQPDYEIIANRSFQEYIDWVVCGGRGGVVIRNYQTIHLSEASFRHSSILDATATEQDMEAVKTMLFTWPAFGIVEHFNKSMALFEKKYCHNIPGLQLIQARVNVTQGDAISFDNQLLAIRHELGVELYNRFCDLNKLDLSLYDSCNSYFLKMKV